MFVCFSINIMSFCIHFESILHLAFSIYFHKWDRLNKRLTCWATFYLRLLLLFFSLLVIFVRYYLLRIWSIYPMVFCSDRENLPACFLHYTWYLALWLIYPMVFSFDCENIPARLLQYVWYLVLWLIYPMIFCFECENLSACFLPCTWYLVRGTTICTRVYHLFSRPPQQLIWTKNVH